MNPGLFAPLSPPPLLSCVVLGAVAVGLPSMISSHLESSSLLVVTERQMMLRRSISSGVPPTGEPDTKYLGVGVRETSRFHTYQ